MTGCTLISANYLFDNYYKKRTRKKDNGLSELTWLIPSFYNLNPSPAFAWHEIVCPSNSAELQKFLKAKSLIISENRVSTTVSQLVELSQSFYPINTFKKDSGWISIKDLSPKSNYDDREEELFMSKSRDSNRMIPTNKTEIERSDPTFIPKSRIVITQK